jgi:hypothetical protein
MAMQQMATHVRTTSFLNANITAIANSAIVIANINVPSFVSTGARTFDAAVTVKANASSQRVTVAATIA